MYYKEVAYKFALSQRHAAMTADFFNKLAATL
jgi:hypothetical protein